MKVKISLLACMVSIALSSGCVSSEIGTKPKNNLDKAAILYKEGATLEEGGTDNFLEAEGKYIEAAKFGSIDALNALGVLYMKTENYSKAQKYFGEAAKKGDEIASFNLANMELTNAYSEPNINKAIELYSYSADKKYAPALVALGDIYATGKGVKVNFDKAETYYLKGADLDSDDALNRLALLYLMQDGFEGDDKTENAKKTVKLIEKAADRGNAQAIYTLSMMYENGFFYEQDHIRSMGLLEKSAELGYPEALFSMGYLYLIGTNVNKDTKKGLELMTQAANYGYSNASNNLGMLALKGEVLPKDYSVARAWFEKGISEGNILSAYNLAMMNEGGLGGDVNLEVARKLYAISADQGYTPSMLKMADFYGTGKGVKEDKENARNWLNKAIETDEPIALMAQANAYFYGMYGYAVDKQRASEWLNKAKNTGSKEALELEKKWNAISRYEITKKKMEFKKNVVNH